MDDADRTTLSKRCSPTCKKLEGGQLLRGVRPGWRCARPWGMRSVMTFLKTVIKRTVIGRIELITGEAQRRRWTRAEKAQILAESFQPGASVSGGARWYGVNRGLLWTWRREARKRGAIGAPTFVPLRIVAEPAAPVSPPRRSLRTVLGQRRMGSRKIARLVRHRAASRLSTGVYMCASMAWSSRRGGLALCLLLLSKRLPGTWALHMGPGGG